MKTFRVILTAVNGKSWADRIPEDEIDAVTREATAAGLRVTVDGEISWQSQLAEMENGGEL